MSNYPFLLDSILTLPTVSGSGQNEVAINALQEAVLAIEEELGVKPSTPYSDVRVRLDILESRINFGVPSGITNDGYIKSPLILWNVPSNVTLTISDGYGAPTENRVNGSLYMRADGYANNDFYIRRDGYWVPIQTEEWVANGDLMGNHLFQTVIGLYNKPLRSTMATVGATQDGYHLTWNNTDGYWEAQTGFIAGSDLAIDSPHFGRTGQKVIRFQNRTFAATAPVGTTATDGSAIKWNNVQNQWEPQASPLVWIGSVNVNDGYTTRTNISSNKALQSPSSAVTSKIGMVNLGSRSSGVTTGTTDNYAAILGGDRNTASISFGLVVGGDSNIVSTGLYATVLNGLTNSATALHAVVLDGYTNIASGVNSFVGTGGNNQANASLSTVLNGIGNTIAAGNIHAAIGFGSSNTITGAAATYSVILGGSGNTTNGQNVFLGTPTNANVQSNYGFVGTGITNTIGTTSNHSVIVSGTTNAVSNASGFSFIGAGNNITVTGLYATVLNATVAVANGLHSLVLQGNTNSVTGSYSTIVNGNNNTISGAVAHAAIVDGYSNTVSGSGSLIVDGYSNTISGIYSSILNGNSNTILSAHSTILNGSSNSLDVTSTNNTVMFGTANALINTLQSIVAGNGNTLTNNTNTRVFGNFNSSQSSNSTITGNSNVIGASSSMNRVFGDNNILGTSSIGNNVFGQSNIVDGYGNSVLLGSTNIANSNFGLVQGQFGKSRLFGQQVQASSRFTAGKVGDAQWSRVVLTGASISGASIPLQLQDTVPTNVTFQDGYSYEMQVRVMIVNTAPIGPNPVVPARFVFDILAHQEAGALVLDNVNQSITTPNTSDDPGGLTRTIGWSVTIGNTGNQLTVIVDPELSSANYVQPTNTASNRRAVATIEMREMTRL